MTPFSLRVRAASHFGKLGTNWDGILFGVPENPEIPIAGPRKWAVEIKALDVKGNEPTPPLKSTYQVEVLPLREQRRVEQLRETSGRSPRSYSHTSQVSQGID